MGLRYRGKTKGKDAWLNWAWSEKNGLGVSASAKVGPFTLNTGNGTTTKKRLWTNLPGGFYHVENLSEPTATSTPTPTSPAPSNSRSGFGIGSIFEWIGIGIMGFFALLGYLTIALCYIIPIGFIIIMALSIFFGKW
jgi:hypothetical protein